jgi:hypothetical protein
MSLIFNTQGVWTSSTSTSTSLLSTITIFGIPVNGYNKLVSTATATSSVSGSTEVPATATAESSSTASSPASATASAGGGGGLSTGASIGIGVGLGIGGLLAVLGAMALIWRMCRRSRRATAGGPAPGDNTSKEQAAWYYGGAPAHHTGSPYDQETVAATPMSEMPDHNAAKYGSYNSSVYEAPGRYEVLELDSSARAEPSHRR